MGVVERHVTFLSPLVERFNCIITKMQVQTSQLGCSYKDRNACGGVITILRHLKFKSLFSLDENSFLIRLIASKMSLKFK